MTDSNHTPAPAPWGVVRSDPAEGADVWWIVGNRDAHNGEVDIGSVAGGSKHSEPNARLIAAAPDLLSALRGLMPEGWGDDDTMDHMRGVKAARAAIAKATGREACPVCGARDRKEGGCLTCINF